MMQYKAPVIVTTPPPKKPFYLFFLNLPDIMGTDVLHQSGRIAQNSNYPLNLLRCYPKKKVFIHPSIHPLWQVHEYGVVLESKPAARQESAPTGLSLMVHPRKKNTHFHLGHIFSQTNIHVAVEMLLSPFLM